MTRRQRLSDRRSTIRETIAFQGMFVNVDAGLDPALRVRETFIRPVGKSDLNRDDAFDEIGITISRGLQSGLAFADLVKLYPGAGAYTHGLVKTIAACLERVQLGLDRVRVR